MTLSPATLKREDVQPEKRRPLTKLEFAKLAVQQNGKCAKCGCKLSFEPHQVRDEHVNSLHGGGSNELSNRELWCVPCTKPKDKADAARHAKIKRLRGETGQLKRREENGPKLKSKSNWPKGRTLPTNEDRERVRNR